MHGGEFVIAADGPPAHDRGDSRREPDDDRVAGVAVPRGRDQQERPRACPRGTVSDVREVVRPRVDELEDVVAARGVRDPQLDRADAEVHLGHRVERVVVDRHECVRGAGERSGVTERIERGGRVGADSRRRVTRHLIEVEHEGEPVEVGLNDRLTIGFEGGHGDQAIQSRPHAGEEIIPPG